MRLREAECLGKVAELMDRGAGTPVCGLQHLCSWEWKNATVKTQTGLQGECMESRTTDPHPKHCKQHEELILCWGSERRRGSGEGGLTARLPLCPKRYHFPSCKLVACVGPYLKEIELGKYVSITLYPAESPKASQQK